MHMFEKKATSLYTEGRLLLLRGEKAGSRYVMNCMS